MSNAEPSIDELAQTVPNMPDGPVAAGVVREFKGQPVGARLTVVLNAYHAAPGQQPSQFNATCSEVLTDQEEEAYTRRTKASLDWRTVELAWVTDNPGTIIIYNTAGMGASQQLTEKQLVAVDSAVLEVRVAGSTGVLLVKPRRCIMVAIEATDSLQIRGRVDKIPYTVWASPE